MQGILRRRVFSGRISLSSQRCFSQLAQKNASLQENDVTVPKMPPFDYSPPPYNGPTVDEIMAKRKAYLSPSLFHLYKKPVSHSPTPDHFSSSSSLPLVSEKSCISLFHFLKMRVSITSPNKKTYGQIKTRVNPSQDQDNVGFSYLNR